MRPSGNTQNTPLPTLVYRVYLMGCYRMVVIDQCSRDTLYYIILYFVCTYANTVIHLSGFILLPQSILKIKYICVEIGKYFESL